MKKNIFLLVLFAFIIVISGCKKKVDPVIDEDQPRPDDISSFIWSGLYDYYLWYNDVDKLDPDYFGTTNDFWAYLNGFGSDYEALFEDLLYQRGIVDRWSWIVDDWEEQEQSFSGISKSMGFDFRLVKYSDTDGVFGYVRYVIPDSPADLAGIKRGDLFTAVDGQDLDVNNYYNLLFEQDSYTLSLAEFVGNYVTQTGVSVDLTAVVLQEDPVHMAEIIDIGDGQKTAYLVYNAFTSDFDARLNDVFGEFKSQGATRLILDLRYNGGGSIRSAVHLASMIYSADPSLLFASFNYNDKLQAYFIDTYGADDLNEYFAEYLDTTTINHTPELPLINSLGLTEVYIIGTSNTASASEMIINGLEPYINVIQVGDTTVGKYVGSFTVKDYYTTGSLNTAHKWAMQPIVLKISNASGTSDYYQGLLPDVPVEEDIRSLLPLGDPEETLLAATIDYILGTSTKSMLLQDDMPRFRDIAGSTDVKPMSSEMYIRYPGFDPLTLFTRN